MTHPFHPLFDREYELVVYRHNWGEDRVYFHDAEGALCSIPAAWTNAIAPDAFVIVAAGRCHFRWQDLVSLADLVRRSKRAESQTGVKQTSPSV